MGNGSWKSLVIIGNLNAITYKEIFPLMKDNKLWIGATNNGQDMVFEVPEGATIAPSDREKAAKLGYKGNYTRLGNACWYTNLEHGRRHQPLSLMSMADNLKFSKHKQIRENGYRKYDNYDAIDVPFTDAIPSDYDGIMGVPVTFLDKYNPEQFEIVGRDGDLDLSVGYSFFTPPDEAHRQKYRQANITWRVQNAYFVIDGNAKTSYKRLFVRLRKDGER